jgi:small subunit ribosomal protein S18
VARFIKRQRKARNCPLCESESIVDYKDVALLKRFVSERGKILGRARTGVCAKHQRQITRSIKISRIVAFMPFSQA